MQKTCHTGLSAITSTIRGGPAGRNLDEEVVDEVYKTYLSEKRQVYKRKVMLPKMEK